MHAGSLCAHFIQRRLITFMREGGKKKKKNIIHGQMESVYSCSLLFTTNSTSAGLIRSFGAEDVTLRE